MVMMMSHQTITSQQIRELDSFELKELFTGDQRSELALHEPDHADEIQIYVAESVHKECFLLLWKMALTVIFLFPFANFFGTEINSSFSNEFRKQNWHHPLIINDSSASF